MSDDETVYTEATRSANWKTYTDPNNLFVLKYPPDWTYKSGEPPYWYSKSDSQGMSAKTLYFSKPGSGAALSIFISKAVDLNVIIRQLGFNGTVEDIMLDGVSGKTIKFNMDEANQTYRIQDFDFLKNMSRYSLRISYHLEDSQLGEVLHKILSTFKFQ